MGCWRDLMKDSILLHDTNSFAVLEAICCKGSGGFPTLVLLGVMDGCGSRGTSSRDGVGRCHGFAPGSKVDRMGVVLSDSEGAGARRRAAGIRVGGTHELTNGFKMTEVGEEDRSFVVVVFGWTISMLSTGAAQGGWGLGQVRKQGPGWTTTKEHLVILVDCCVKSNIVYLVC